MNHVFKNEKIIYNPYIDFQNERMKSKIKMLHDMIKECTKVHAPNLDFQHPKYLVELVPQLSDPHPRFPTFSDAIEVKYGGPEVGRFCVSKKTIEIGEDTSNCCF